MTRGLALALAAVVVGGMAAAPAARAADGRQDRFAIVIGSNAGDVDEPVLRWAERDAQRMGEVLTRLGGVPDDHLLVLSSPSRVELQMAVAAFGVRVRQAGPDALLFVYYSGHADAASLLLSGTRVSFSELKQLVRELGAKLTVFIVDACRSAGLITAKGGTPIAPFALDAPTPDVRGLAIVTSSASGEDAQESEHLAGGVFTHHLLAGLMGAADSSGDRRVALSEVYRYAYAQTLVSTAGSDIVQHPSFAFDLHGEDDVIVTEVGTTASQGLLELDGRGRWLVFERFGDRRLVSEVDLEQSLLLSLVPGAYLVRRVDGAMAAEKRVLLQPGERVATAIDDLEPIPFRHAVRRGYGQLERRALSVGVATEVAGPVLAGTGVFVGGALTGQLDLADLALEARVRFGGSSGDNGFVGIDQTLLGVDAGLFHLFELGRHGFGFGVRLGVDWLAQRFSSAGGADDVDQVVPRVGPFVRAEWALGSSVALGLDAGMDAYLVDLADDQGHALTPRLVPTVALGVAILWP
ncbi:MAG: caspase family protein [Myxococcota bacterium]